MNKTASRTVALAAVAAALGISPALADKGGHGQGGKHKDRAGSSHVERDARYARDAAGCPPGLARKDNGCLPPGQAKKLAIGEPLPAGAVYTIPSRLRATLPPPPAGYRYAVVDNQLVLVSGSNLVVDIIRSLLG